MHIDHIALHVHGRGGALAFLERYLGGTAGSKYHTSKQASSPTSSRSTTASTSRS